VSRESAVVGRDLTVKPQEAEHYPTPVFTKFGRVSTMLLVYKLRLDRGPDFVSLSYVSTTETPLRC
jgi:hypothetical protein